MLEERLITEFDRMLAECPELARDEAARAIASAAGFELRSAGGHALASAMYAGTWLGGRLVQPFLRMRRGSSRDS